MSERLDALMTRLGLEPPDPEDPFDDLGLHVDEDVVSMCVACPGQLTGGEAEIDEIGRLLLRCLFFIYHGGLERALQAGPDTERDVIVELFLLRQELPRETRSILEDFTRLFAARGIVLNVILITKQELDPSA